MVASILSTSSWTSKVQELHPAFYITSWMFFSNTTILFNKWILDNAGFPYPLILTTVHLIISTVLTQLLARFTTVLDSRRDAGITGRIYMRAIVPIGVFFTASLAFSNLTYLYLSVAFIQMLKALGPVSTLWISWLWGISNPSFAVVVNICIITFGVILSSLGEIKFSWLGFAFQMAGIFAESCRLLLIQILLKGEGPDGSSIKMDPLVSLYYYAPICAVLNGIIALVFEAPTFHWQDFERVGVFMLVLNGLVAFMLNVASVFLIGKTSALTMNLAGILKSILLVIASMLIWASSVSFMQGLGYTIALAGMFYYSMGKDAASNVQYAKDWVASNLGSGQGRSSLVRSAHEWVQVQLEGRPAYNRVNTTDDSIEIENRGRSGADVEAGHPVSSSPEANKDRS